MVTKKGAGGLQQPYIPAGHGEESGEYTSFDSAKLNRRIKILTDAIGVASVVKYAYENHKPIIHEGKHFKDRLKERGIHQIYVAEALLKPLKTDDKIVDKYGRVSTKYYGPNATVAVNPETGKIITVHKTRRNIRNKFKER